MGGYKNYVREDYIVILIVGRVANASGKIIGYKILEVETGLTKTTSLRGVRDNIQLIKNAELSDSGNIVGVNGGLNRYTILSLDGKLLSNPSIIIIGRHGADYICTNHSGDIQICDKTMVIQYGSRFGIANGKVEHGDIKTLSGEQWIDKETPKERTATVGKRAQTDKERTATIEDRAADKENTGEFKPARRSRNKYQFTGEERSRIAELAIKATEGLNYQQKEAATSLTGNIRLIAGAGTGKTNTLTKRIANLVASGVNPERILSVTFTNKAASEMRERTASLLNISQQYLRLQTFHSLCNDILRQSIHVIGWRGSYTLGGRSAFKEMVADLMSNDPDIKSIPNTELTYIKKKILDYDQEIRKKEDYRYTEYLVDKELPEIGRLKDLIAYEGERDKLIDQGRWDYGKDKTSPVFNYVCHIFAYQRRISYLSFDDLIALTILVFKRHPNVLNYWQDMFDCIQVDEFQDTSPMQFELIKLLSEKSGNLFVVGDPDQSIYKFRNAAPEILINLDKNLKDLKDIVMDINYRSTEEILAVGNEVIRLSDNRIPKDLKTAFESQRGNLPKVIYDQSGDKLAEKIVRNIQIEIKMGTKLSEIAVLYRSKMSESLKNVLQLLTLNKIKFKVWGNAKLQRQPEYEFTCELFNAILNRENPYHILSVLRHVRGMRLTKKTKETFKDSMDCIATYKHMYNNHKFSVESYNSLNEIADFIDKVEYAESREEGLAQLVRSGAISDLIQIVFTEESSEFADIIRDQLCNYIEEAKESGDKFNLAYLVSSIALIEDDSSEESAEAVQIMTIHKAKGLEFDCVYVLNINMSGFPSRRCVGEDLDEEVRLAYVAYTRAKKKLYLTCNDSSGYFGGGPSIFVAGLTKESLSMGRVTELKWSSFKNNATAEFYRAKGR